jgi:D-3-phosphoglycerate dehydrogenase
VLRNGSVGRELGSGVFAADLPTIQREADAIVLHVPLNPGTWHLVNDDFLSRCLRKPLFVNVSRGGLVQNDALVRALDAGVVSGAALDVVEGEPAPPANLVARADVTVTPHVAFSSAASLLELRHRSTDDVVRVLRGERPHHPCNIPG